MEQEFDQTKPEAKFKREADEYLSLLENYKKMKQYEANIKHYMVENDLDLYTNDRGRITIDHVKVNCLNRALIEDITQHYEETDRIIMRKTLKSAKLPK